MPKLVVASDIHGYLSAWKYVLSLLSEHDILAIAGDFFDTKYGQARNPDYAPEIIREEFTALKNRKHFVYGNCDDESFLPGYGYTETFTFNGIEFLLTHGNFHTDGDIPFDVKITGHTHRKELIKKGNQIYLNPGSIALPKEGPPSYAVIENKKIMLMGMNKGVIAEYDVEKEGFI